MPNYEYRCDECSVEFEELLLNKEDIELYSDSYPCPVCSKPAPKQMSSFAFSFKGGVRGTSGVHGNSGVHDLDYPVLDKAVARSAEKRWDIHNKRQEAINKFRKESGSHAVAMTPSGDPLPVDKSVLDIRQKAMPVLKNFVKQVNEDNKK